MENTLGIFNGFYEGIFGQSHAKKNALAILEVYNNPKVWQGRQTFAFEARGEKILFTGMWDNAVAVCDLLTKEEARKRWRWLVKDKKAIRSK